MRFSPSYLVLDDFGGRLGRAWAETDGLGRDRRGAHRPRNAPAPPDGGATGPRCQFNNGGGWSRDASEEIAEALHQLCADRDELPPSLEEFLVRYGQDTAIHSRCFSPMEYRGFHFSVVQTAAPRRGWIWIAQIDGKERRGTGFDRADAAANPQRYIDRWIYINSEYGLK